MPAVRENCTPGLWPLSWRDFIWSIIIEMPKDCAMLSQKRYSLKKTHGSAEPLHWRICGGRAVYPLRSYKERSNITIKQCHSSFYRALKKVYSQQRGAETETINYEETSKKQTDEHKQYVKKTVPTETSKLLIVASGVRRCGNDLKATCGLNSRE